MGVIHLLRHGALAELRLDNPAKLNCLTPAMLATGLGSDVQRPLATVVVCGLVSATLLTLLLLPNLYYVIELRAQRSAERRRRRAAERGELDDESESPVTAVAAAERMAP